MKLVLVPVLSFFLFTSVTYLLVGVRSILEHRSLSNSGLPSPLFLFSVFNMILVAIILAKSHSSGAYETATFIHLSDEEEGYSGHGNKYSFQLECDCDGAHDEETRDSEGGIDPHDRLYDEDVDPDSGSADDTACKDEEEEEEEEEEEDLDEGDDELEKRIEDFIDKVIKGWQKERNQEYLNL